jgi:acyl-CoA thioesterase FadM
MPRVKLTEQEFYEFHYDVEIQPQDINFSGHVGNDNLVTLMGAARAHAFHSLNLSELDLGDGRTGIIMADLVVNYTSEAFLFDKLRIDIHIDEIGKSSFRMFYRVMRNTSIIALAESGFATFNYMEKKITQVPKSFLELLSSH